MSDLLADIRQLEAIKKELEKRDCEKSLESFVKAAWHIIEPSTKLIWNWHLSTLCGYLEAFHEGRIPKRLIINIPPGTMKSIIASVMYPAWVWTKRPGERFLAVTNEQGLATRDALKMKQIVTNEWFQSHWPINFKSDQNEKTLYVNEHLGFRQAQGITSSNTGKRGDCLIGETLVSTEHGDIRIDALCAMDNPPKVWSYNHSTKAIELKAIVAAKTTSSNDLYKVVSLSSDIISTGNHPIFTGSNYEKAENIARGLLSIMRESDNDAARDSSPMLSMQDNKTNVYNLWEGFFKGLCGTREKLAQGYKGRAILLKNLQFASKESRPNNKELRALRERVSTKIDKKIKKILLYRMLLKIAIAAKDTNTKALRFLRQGNEYIKFTAALLLNGLQKFSPFYQDDWGRELAFSNNYEFQWPVFENERINKASGWKSMLNMFGETRTYERIGSTSYRLGCEQQYAREPYNALRLLPHNDTQKRYIQERIIAAEPFNTDGNTKITVYDIQVEGNSNFFANGLLVHNCIIIDDPIDAQNAFSDVLRKTVNDTWDQSLGSRLNDLVNSGVILIMQRLHTLDLTGHLLGKKDSIWKALSIPMRYEGFPTFDAGKDIGRPDLNDPRTEIGELLFPAKFPESAIQEQETNLQEYGTAGQLQQRPSPLGGGILKSKYFKLWPSNQKMPDFDHIFSSWDTAYSTEGFKTNAHSAMTMWGIFYDIPNKRHAIMLFDGWNGQVDYHDLRQRAKKVNIEWRPDCQLIEKKASGISLIQDLKRANIKVRSVTPDQDKIARAYTVSSLLQSGAVYVKDDPTCKRIIEYVSSFPNGAPPSADYTDTVTQALNYLQKNSWVNHPDDDLFEMPVIQQHQYHDIGAGY